jgi:hypothetical protein
MPCGQEDAIHGSGKRAFESTHAMVENGQHGGGQRLQPNSSAPRQGPIYGGFSGDLLNGFEYSAAHREDIDSSEASRPAGLAGLVSNIFSKTEKQDIDTKQVPEAQADADSGGTVSQSASTNASQRYVQCLNDGVLDSSGHFVKCLILMVPTS